MDKVHRFYTEDLALRASAASTTALVARLGEVHQASPVATMAMGRSITAAALMASHMRKGHFVSIQFSGNGPLGNVFVEAGFEGDARGYCTNPQLDLPPAELSKAIGQGLLTVSRNLPFQKQPQMGVVPIVSGEIGDDIAHYLFQSHQIPSILALGVYLDRNGVRAAGGVLIELLPGEEEKKREKLVATLEEKARSAGSLSELIASGAPPAEWLKAYVHDSPLVPVEHDFELKYTCKCSDERVDRTLKLLGRKALLEMIDEKKPVNVNCEFCGKAYVVAIDRLNALLQTIH